jgi:hypothetical protein
MKTTTVRLFVETKTGEDDFGNDITTPTPVDVPGVLVGSPTQDDIVNALQLYGKKVSYVLGIPKGDTHNWTDAEVEFWGDRYRTIGFPVTGESENIPLRWGQNVKVERYG